MNQHLCLLGRSLLLALALCGSLAAGDTEVIESAKEAFAKRDFTEVVDLLKPVIDRPVGEATEQTQLAKEVAASAYQLRGEDHFRNARIKEALADFDAFIALLPEEAAGHWQRGIALYYAGKFQDGVNQFELHRTVNPDDVENSLWHLLCLMRLPGATVENSREQYLQVTRDRRIPMAQLQNLYTGKGTEEDVITAASSASEDARFYTDLYLGLYYEMIGDKEKSLPFVARAASNPTASHYMGDVARTHLLLRGQADANGN
jgi:lipoprotein NlpI